MKHRVINLLLLAGIILFVVSLRQFGTARGQSGDSSCRTCHETEGKNPVGNQGDWHVQHNSGDLCAVCHGGNAQASDQEGAHTGMMTSPLDNPQASCAICHPDDAEERVAHYAAIAGPAETETQPTIQNTPTMAAATAVPAQPAATLPPGAPTVDYEIPREYRITPTIQPPATNTPVPTALAAGPAARPPSSTKPGMPGQGGWFAVLRFSRGPLFKASLSVFALGMLYRLAQALRPGWRRRHTPHKGNALAGVAVSFLKGLLVLPFIPWIKGVFRRSAVTYIAGGMFHLGLLVVVFFSKTHMQAWKSVLGFGWPVLPQPVVGWLAALGIVAMLVLLVNRAVNPVLRLISGPAEWLNWLFVFLPMATGFIMARRVWFPYEVTFSVHMLLVDFLLVWIPLSRISHFIFYFFSRAIHGVEFERRAAG